MKPKDMHTNPSLETTVESVRKQFESHFGRTPQYIVAAPGRVNLIGEHIDYNDGYVLPMAIERYVVIAGDKREFTKPATAVFISDEMSETASIPLDSFLEPEFKGWSAYVAGVIAGFQAHDINMPTFDAVVCSNLPIGGGLSSSAALEVAVATLLEVLTGQQLTPKVKALLCQKAEHDFAGVPCGIMDQFSSVFGRQSELMLLDCQTQEIEAVPFLAEDATILITNTNANHKLIDGEYATRRTQCDSALAKIGQTSWRNVDSEALEFARNLLTGTEFRRAHHVITEIERTAQAAHAVVNNDWKALGEMMNASHTSLRYDFEVSCYELDTLVELANEMSDSIFGSRMTGAGFGGSTVTLVKSQDVKEVQATLDAQYEEKTGITPSSFVSHPAQGAHIIATRQ